MMEAALTSETPADNYFTRQYIPEDNSELHTRRRENLKSHMLILMLHCSYWVLYNESHEPLQEAEMEMR
jgi:hypothetical protein